MCEDLADTLVLHITESSLKGFLRRDGAEFIKVVMHFKKGAVAYVCQNMFYSHLIQ